MKVTVSLAKNILAPLGITTENTWIGDNNFNNFKRRNE